MREYGVSLGLPEPVIYGTTVIGFVLWGTVWL